MKQQKYDLVCKTFIQVVLEPLLIKDEPDARYTINNHFDSRMLKIKFFAIKERPGYVIDKQYQYLGSYDSYELEYWYDKYKRIQAKLKFNLWETCLIREE